MSRENIEIVERMCAAYEAGDWEAATASLHPDIEWDVTGIDWPDAEVFRGREAVVKFFRRFLGTWEDYYVTFDEFTEVSDDHVVVSVRDGGRGKQSGAEVEREWAQLWTVRDGRAVAFCGFHDRASALAAPASRARRSGAAPRP